MKPILTYALLSTMLFLACKPKAKNTDEKTIPNLITNSTTDYSNLIGSYVGNFGENKITFLISKALNDSIEGRSVVAGNDRPFIGTIKYVEGKFNIDVKEPGDNKNDGIFTILIDEKKIDTINGSWKPFQTSENIIAKNFVLKRRSFVYLKDVGEYPQASRKILTEEEIGELSKAQLSTMRNEIFARHGYCFKKKNLRMQFENKDWYIPNTVDIKNELTSIEKSNIELIKRFEKYEDEYGDDFGR